MPFLKTLSRDIDWVLLGSALLLCAAGLITMNSFLSAQAGTVTNSFFDQQLVWILVSVAVFFAASMADWRFLRTTPSAVAVFLAAILSLVLLFALGTVTKGALSRFDLG